MLGNAALSEQCCPERAMLYKHVLRGHTRQKMLYHSSFHDVGKLQNSA